MLVNEFGLSALLPEEEGVAGDLPAFRFSAWIERGWGSRPGGGVRPAP
jgi:hypothetical protein